MSIAGDIFAPFEFVFNPTKTEKKGASEIAAMHFSDWIAVILGLVLIVIAAATYSKAPVTKITNVIASKAGPGVTSAAESGTIAPKAAPSVTSAAESGAIA